MNRIHSSVTRSIVFCIPPALEEWKFIPPALEQLEEDDGPGIRDILEARKEL